MIGRAVVDGRRYALAKAELHVARMLGSWYMFLATHGDTEGSLGFALWGVELPLLCDLDDLDAQRIHVRPDGETYDDDTLGTDLVGMHAGLSYWGIGFDRGASFGELLVDFRRVKGQEFRIHLFCKLSREDDDGPEMDYLESSGEADFSVVADDDIPDDGSSHIPT